MSQFDWPITPKKNETMEAPQIEGSILKYRVPPPLVIHVYIIERTTAFAKASGIKSEVVLRTLWGTYVGRSNVCSLGSIFTSTK
jgi:hypothetical protein